MNQRTRSFIIALAVLVGAVPAIARGASPAPTAVATVAVQRGRVVRATDLRDLPSASGKLLVVVPANSEVVVLERMGGWYRVTLPAREGWVRLTAVRFATATPAASGGLTASLGFLKSGRSAVQTGTVTTGVRGLSETDLANSVPDSAAVDALDALAVTPDDAKQHAREAELKPVELPFIKAPKEPGAGKDGKGKKGKDHDEEDDG